MTNAELLALMQSEGFNILDYEIPEGANDTEIQERLPFLNQVASLADDETLDKPEPISCMVNCVISYLQCVDGGGGFVYAVCHTMLVNCLANCGGVE